MKTKKFENLLAMAFMCHQRPDRSFYFRGKQFPICARCTGILLGYFLGILIAIVSECAYHGYFLLLLLPMIVDGGTQHWKGKESNNYKRLVTGVLGGIGIIYIFINIHLFTVWWLTCLFAFLGW